MIGEIPPTLSPWERVKYDWLLSEVRRRNDASFSDAEKERLFYVRYLHEHRGAFTDELRPDEVL